MTKGEALFEAIDNYIAVKADQTGTDTYRMRTEAAKEQLIQTIFDLVPQEAYATSNFVTANAATRSDNLKEDSNDRD